MESRMTLGELTDAQWPWSGLCCPQPLLCLETRRTQQEPQTRQKLRASCKSEETLTDVLSSSPYPQGHNESETLAARTMTRSVGVENGRAQGVKEGMERRNLAIKVFKKTLAQFSWREHKEIKLYTLDLFVRKDLCFICV